MFDFWVIRNNPQCLSTLFLCLLFQPWSLDSVHRQDRVWPVSPSEKHVISSHCVCLLTRSLTGVPPLTCELVEVVWRRSKSQSAAARWQSPYRSGLCQTISHQDENWFVQIQVLKCRRTRRFIQTCTHESTMMLTAKKTPNLCCSCWNKLRTVSLADKVLKLLSTCCSFIVLWWGVGGVSRLWDMAWLTASFPHELITYSARCIFCLREMHWWHNFFFLFSQKWSWQHSIVLKLEVTLSLVQCLHHFNAHFMLLTPSPIHILLQSLPSPRFWAIVPEIILSSASPAGSPQSPK